MLTHVSKIAISIILVELCLGGGGRFTAIGSVSLRMILFCIAILLTMTMIFNGKKIPFSLWKLLLVFVGIITIGIVLGAINHSPQGLLWEDVKPLLYFFILPFFALTIDRDQTILFSRIIKACSLIIAVVFLLTLLLIHSGVVPFLSFYELTSKTGELFYRGELSFFYKGFLFLGIGVIFYFFTDSKNKKLSIVILSIAILLSVTRGLLFSLFITFSFFLLSQKGNYRAVFLACGAAALAVVIAIWGNLFTVNLSRWIDSNQQPNSVKQSSPPSPNLFGARSYSDEGRIAQINEVIDQMSLSSMAIGHGFGQGISSRPVHMEIAYLEILHKQGILGLAFWAVVSFMIFITFRRSDQSALAKAFLFSSLFVFVESATNQYFNNPIGMSVLLLSLVSLDKLKKEI